MEKLTTILAVVLEGENAVLVLDKAVAVARCFRADVEILVNDAIIAHVLTTRCSEMQYVDVTLHSVASSNEPTCETILRRVFTSRPDLVVKAAAKDGSDWSLANECPAPVLLVRKGVWQNPTRFAAAVDVSDHDNEVLARSILHTAGFLALGTHGNLDILYSEREANDETVRMQRAVRLAQIVREFHVGCERLQMFAGDPAKRLPPLVAARRYDVLVLGGEAPGEGSRQRAPDTVFNLMEVTESDVVLVKAPSSSAALMDARNSSRQQRVNQAQELA